MGFKIYSITPNADGSTGLDEGQAVRFSGRDGLVAIWTKSHRDLADRPWRVLPDEWLKVTGLGLDPERHWIVFEQRDEQARLRIARLLSVSGVCGGTKTDMLIALEPLVAVVAGTTISVRREPTPRIWSEELVLEGTPAGKTDSWNWGKPHLAIGSATVGTSVLPKW